MVTFPSPGRGDGGAEMEPGEGEGRPLALVIDDEVVMRTLTAGVLEKAGLSVAQAADGALGLAAFERLRPEIVLLDVLMPGMDGYAVCASIRRSQGGERTPVLMITVLDDPESIRRAYEAGATDFVTKPIAWATLGHRVRYMLRASRALFEAADAEARYRDLSSHLQSAIEEERRRIAREIHDELGNRMMGLKLDLSSLRERLPRGRPELLDMAASMMRDIDETIRKVSSISRELRPAMLDDLGIAAAIEWQAGEFRKRTGIACEVAVRPEEIVLDRASSTALFRIFQEALTNIARHANATHVTVTLTSAAAGVGMVVRDNGRGISPNERSDPRSFGLVGMRERVLALGGTVRIQGVPGAGTTVTVTLPPGE